MRRRGELTRREWIQLVGAVGAAASCGDNLAPPIVAVATLDPTHDGFLVAIADPNSVEVALDVGDGVDVVASRLVLLDANGFGVADISGLVASQRYEVRVTPSSQVRTPSLFVRTAPLVTDSRMVRIAVSADYDPNPDFETALVDHMLAREPELFVSLGDFPYTDNGPDVAQSLVEYRDRHMMARTAPALQRLHAGIGMYGIYDDHEFHNDWNPVFVEDEPARYAAAMQAWDEFFPIRNATGEIRYRSWRWGAHLECFLLDARRFRSPNGAEDNLTKSMLGATQRDWLIDGLRRSTATFKLIFSSVPLDFGIGDDHWRAFSTDRDALLDLLVGVPGVLFMSADQHYFAAHRHARGVREIQVGPLARGLGDFGEDNLGVMYRHAAFNVAIVEADGSSLRVSGIDGTGTRFYEEVLTPELLTPQ